MTVMKPTTSKMPIATKIPTPEEIKALMAAGERERQSSDDSKFAQALAVERSRARGRTQGLVLPAWEKLGIDVKDMEKVQADAQQAMRRLADERKAAAINGSAEAQKELSARAAEWIDRMRQIKDRPVTAPFTPRLDYVAKPLLIWPTHGLVFDDFHYEDLNSWGKVHLPRTGSSGGEHLSFWFLWENPDDAYALINVSSFLSLNGTAECTAEGGWLGITPGGTSSLVLSVYLVPWLLPNTLPPFETSQLTQVLSFGAYGGGLFESVGDIELRNVRGADFVNYTQMILPPRASTLFEVQLDAGFTNDDGTTEFDFASGDFKVVCPIVFISILT